MRTPRVSSCAWSALVLAATVLGLARRPEPPAREAPPEPRTSVTLHVELASPDDDAALLRATRQLGAAQVRPLFSAPDPALRAWRLVTLPTSFPEAESLCRWMERAGVARHAYVEPVTSLPSRLPESSPLSDEDPHCPIRTPSFQDLQGYLAPAPEGIDAAAAWRLPGGRGQNVWFADLEGGWNTSHEDLPGERIRHLHGQPMRDRMWQQHGTAVLGEVASRDNELGDLGIAPEVARIYTSSISGSTVANALDAAQRALRPGDVLLIELQSGGPRDRYIPVEYYPDVFQVVQRATQRGVLVVEAAGNGGENLDHPAYRGAFDPTKRHSGAILVGAGAPPRPGFTDRSRLDFSNYGRRVDVQGWGLRVATLDYGDLQSCDGPTDRHYTGQFSGTSSASPIVAGAALLLQSVYEARTGSRLEPARVRELLRDTGSPQTDGPYGPATQHIGPRPNLAAALAALGLTGP